MLSVLLESMGDGPHLMMFIVLVQLPFLYSSFKHPFAGQIMSIEGSQMPKGGLRGMKTVFISKDFLDHFKCLIFCEI